MKKVLTLLFVCVLGFSLVGCGDKNPAPPGGGTPPPDTNPTKPATP